MEVSVFQITGDVIKSKIVPNICMSTFKLKGPISRNFALELIVGRSFSGDPDLKGYIFLCSRFNIQQSLINDQSHFVNVYLLSKVK